MNALTEKPAPAAENAVSVAPPRRRLRRAVLRITGALAVIVVVAILGNYWLAEGRYIESTDNAYVQGDIAVLAPRIEGDVLAIDVADNQFVRAGAPLIELDPADWQLKLEQSRAAVQEAEAALQTAHRQAAQARAAIAQSAAMVQQADAEATRASADAARNGRLVSNGSVSRQSYDLALADNLKAEASLAAMRAQREMSAQAASVAEAQVAQAEARLASAQAAARLAERDLGYTVIRSPIDGIVGNRAAQLGEHVKAGAQLISVTPARDHLYVVANFKETQLRRMQPSQRVTLAADIVPDAPVAARVDSLAPATGALFSLLPPENATGNFTKVVQRVPVKIAIDAPVAARAGWLRAGLSVTAEVDTRGPDAVRRGILGSAAHTLGLQ